MSSPSSTAVPPPPPLSSGLSTGAKAGIAAACAVGVVVLVSLCIYLHISYRKQRDPAYHREKQSALSASYHKTYQNSIHQGGEGGAPLLRDGSYMDLSMQSLGTPRHGSPMVGSDDGLSPGRFEHNASYSNSNLLSPSSPARQEKERWRESHSIAGYFDRKTAEPESPRLSTGDRMVAEWRKEEIERARERSMDREREEKKKEPHPMAAYQNALPPFYPRGFKDISGDREDPVQLGDHYLDPEVHEMDVGVEGVHTRTEVN